MEPVDPFACHFEWRARSTKESEMCKEEMEKEKDNKAGTDEKGKSKQEVNKANDKATGQPVYVSFAAKDPISQALDFRVHEGEPRKDESGLAKWQFPNPLTTGRKYGVTDRWSQGW